MSDNVRYLCFLQGGETMRQKYFISLIAIIIAAGFVFMVPFDAGFASSNGRATDQPVVTTDQPGDTVTGEGEPAEDGIATGNEIFGPTQADRERLEERAKAGKCVS